MNATSLSSSDVGLSDPCLFPLQVPPLHFRFLPLSLRAEVERRDRFHSEMRARLRRDVLRIRNHHCLKPLRPSWASDCANETFFWEIMLQVPCKTLCDCDSGFQVSGQGPQAPSQDIHSPQLNNFCRCDSLIMREHVLKAI